MVPPVTHMVGFHLIWLYALRDGLLIFSLSVLSEIILVGEVEGGLEDSSELLNELLFLDVEHLVVFFLSNI